MLTRDDATAPDTNAHPRWRSVRSVEKLVTRRRAGLPEERELPEGERTPEQEAAHRRMVEEAIRALRQGHAAHTRRTLAEVSRAYRSDDEQVDVLLAALNRAHARGKPSDEVLHAFLDTFETWLEPAGVAKVDLLFDRVDLDRAPHSVGLALLALTRLTREHFARREAFFGRLRGFLIGKGGRTEKQIDAMLRGLRA